MRIAATGFCLCGIAEEPPRPEPLPSCSSLTSVWASRVTSRAILPSAPQVPVRAAASSTIRWRFVCQGSGGTGRPSSSPRRARSAEVYTEACQGLSDTTPASPNDFVAAVAALRGVTVTAPKDVTLGGLPGKQVTLNSAAEQLRRCR